MIKLFFSKGFSIILFFLLTACEEQVVDVQTNTQAPFQCDHDNGGLNLPDGFCAAVVADNLGFVRHLVVGNSGDLYVTLRNQRLNLGGLLQLRDLDMDGRMEDVHKVHDLLGMGIAVKEDKLYFASDDKIYHYHIQKGELLNHADSQVVVQGFPQQNLHAGKTLVLGENNDLFVNVGSKSNACQLRDLEIGSPGLEPCSEFNQHAGIWRFDASRINQEFTKDGNVYASGIRNAYALDWHPNEKKLYAVQHGRDQLAFLWPNHFAAEQELLLPAEELFIVEQGEAYSWPYCYYDPVLNKRILAPEYGGDGKEQGRCNDYNDPLIAFPAHYGPNDLLIYTGEHFPKEYSLGAFIAFHGRHDEDYAYQLVFVSSKADKLSTEWRVFARNAPVEQQLDEFTNIAYRPTGIAQGPDGSLFLSDSVQGRIWRIVYQAKE